MERASYPRVKRGHIVPAVYQRNFAIDDQVLVHFVSDGHTQLRNVKSAAWRPTFYRRTRPDDGPAIDDIEASLSEIERDIKPVFDEILGGAELTLESKGALAQFFGIQLVRGPAFFSKRRELIDEIVSSLDESTVMPGALEAAGGSIAIVQKQVRDIYTGTTTRFVSMLGTGLKTAILLGSMRWHVLDFGAPLLAYSDHPVVVWPAHIHQTHAFATPNFGPLGAIEVRVPLSPELAILMTWADVADEGRRVSVTPGFADELNAFVVSQADEQWMHRPGRIPPVGIGSFTPLSRVFEPSYSPEYAGRSRRRATAARLLAGVAKKTLLGDIKIAYIP
jgi:Protein of unknown function (DUF4238)